MKKPSYKEARRNILAGLPVRNADVFPCIIDRPTAMVAAEALERVNKQPAMKDHERIFFALCFNLRNSCKPRNVVHMLGDTIPHCRCWYYLKKWAGLGFYSYGVTLDLGWFEEDKIPPRYMEILEQGEGHHAGS